jgi:hypothetical protein
MKRAIVEYVALCDNCQRVTQPIWLERLKEERVTTACRMTEVHQKMCLGMALP